VSRMRVWVKMKTNLLWAAITWTISVAPTALAQKGIEVTPFMGGQINTGLDLSTARFNRLEVQNGINYGVSAGYLISNYTGVEFMWNHNQADTLAQPISGGPDLKLFGLSTNQYLGDFVLHFKDRENRLRPFVLFGAGATNLAPDRSHVSSITRFTWVFGGGVNITSASILEPAFKPSGRLHISIQLPKASGAIRSGSVVGLKGTPFS